MVASPELRRPSTPAEFKLGPFLAAPAPADSERNRSPTSKAGGGGETCGTPNSKESKIPPVTSCPPAPKKSKRMVEISSKRRLSEMELFRVGPELMELLFRPLDFGGLPASSPAAKKKRMGCCTNQC